VKLLLDEHFAPIVAVRLRDRGYDVIAVPERQGWRGLPDDQLFDAAQRERRAIVTENVGDYLELDRDFRSRGAAHFGVVLTSNATFPRGRPATLGALVVALDALLADRPAETPDSAVIWLQRTGS
jgi:hypothetical protein